MEPLPHEKKIYEVEKTIEHLKKQSKDSPIFSIEIDKLEKKLEELKESVYKELTPWERVQISRHPKRPKTSDYLKEMFTNFHELSGDRLFRDDPALIGGLAYLEGEKCVVMGQEKGCDTSSRVLRNFGMMCPEGYRKAIRLMKLAEKFSLPVVTLIDTPGAYPGLEAEERGQGHAIAENLRSMMGLKTPIISLVIGEGCSGGALGIGVSDVIGMLEHSYYSVISPEGCASILWHDSSKNQEAAQSLKLNSEDLLRLNIIEEVIKEPLGGAHQGRDETFKRVKTFLLEKIHILKSLSIDLLLEQRYLKYRNMGQFSS